MGAAFTVGQRRSAWPVAPLFVRANKQTFLIRCWARCFSLFAIKNSLFQLQGMRPKEVRISVGSSKRRGAFRSNSLYFPAYQGISNGDAFALASQHSHTKYLL